jgi:hypothetical protein
LTQLHELHPLPPPSVHASGGAHAPAEPLEKATKALQDGPRADVIPSSLPREDVEETDPMKGGALLPLPALIRAIRTSARGAGASTDGDRFEFWKLGVLDVPDLVGLAPALLDATHRLAIHALTGRWPTQLRDCFATASLCCLRKSGSLADALRIRPIACGGAFRRLISRALIVAQMPRIRRAVGLHQVAVGEPSGAEGLVLALRQSLHLPDWCTISFDAVNAFNALSRQRMLEEVAKRLPWMLPFVAFLYEGAIPLYILRRSPAAPGGYTFDVIMSWEGVQQGCVFGTLLYALAERVASDILRSELVDLEQRGAFADSFTPDQFTRPDEFTAATVFGSYADDASGAGPSTAVAYMALRYPELLYEHLGLRINSAKCKILPPLPPEKAIAAAGQLFPLPPAGADDAACVEAHSRRQAVVDAVATFHHVPASSGIELTDIGVTESSPAAGIMALGIPVAMPSGAEQWQQEAVHRVFRAAQAQLPALEAFAARDVFNLQVAHLIVRFCTLQRAVYILRVAHVDHTLAPAKEFDDAVIGALARMFDIDEDKLCCRAVDAAGHTRRRAELPTREGGMGWRSMASIRDIAALSGASSAARVARRFTIAHHRDPAYGSPSSASSPASASDDATPDPDRTRTIASVPFSNELSLHQARERSINALVAACPAHHPQHQPLLAQGRTDSEVVRVHTETVDGLIAASLAHPIPRRQGMQRTLTRCLESGMAARLAADMSEQNAAHLAACAMQGASEWCSIYPVVADVTLAAYQMTIAARIRLQLPLLLAPSRCVHACGDVCDVMGRHFFACKKFGLTIRRHDGIVHAVVACATDAGIPAHLASKADSATAPGAPCTKVDCVLLPQTLGAGMKNTNVDVQMRGVIRRMDDDHSALCRHMGQGAADSVQATLARAEALKRRKHSAGAAALGREFSPWCIHSAGGMGPAAVTLFNSICRFARSQVGPAASRLFKPLWLARLSCTAQRLAADTVRAGVHHLTPTGAVQTRFIQQVQHGGVPHHLRATRPSGLPPWRSRADPTGADFPGAAA